MNKYIWYIVGSTIKRCWNCGKLTNKISITFETHVCSVKCDNEKYREYEKVLKNFDV